MKLTSRSNGHKADALTRLPIAAGAISGLGILAAARTIIKRYRTQRALSMLPLIFTADELFLRSIQGLKLAVNALAPGDACYTYKGEASKLTGKVLDDLVPVRLGDLSSETRQLIEREQRAKKRETAGVIK